MNRFLKWTFYVLDRVVLQSPPSHREMSFEALYEEHHAGKRYQALKVYSRQLSDAMGGCPWLVSGVGNRDLTQLENIWDAAMHVCRKHDATSEVLFDLTLARLGFDKLDPVLVGWAAYYLRPEEGH